MEESKNEGADKSIVSKEDIEYLSKMQGELIAAARGVADAELTHISLVSIYANLKIKEREFMNQLCDKYGFPRGKSVVIDPNTGKVVQDS